MVEILRWAAKELRMSGAWMLLQNCLTCIARSGCNSASRAIWKPHQTSLNRTFKSENISQKNFRWFWPVDETSPSEKGTDKSTDQLIFLLWTQKIKTDIWNIGEMLSGDGHPSVKFPRLKSSWPQQIFLKESCWIFCFFMLVRHVLGVIFIKIFLGSFMQRLES